MEALQTKTIIRKVVFAAVAACSWITLPGCFLQGWSAGGVEHFYITDADGKHVREFLLLRHQYEERWHILRDPDGDNWRPPKLTHLVLLSGDGGEITTDGFFRIRAFTLTPPTGVVSRMSDNYRFYAHGLEVQRFRIGDVPQTNGHTYKLRPAHDVIPDAPPGSRGEPLIDIVTGRAKAGAERIIEDLDDDHLWSQVRKRWAKGKDKPAILYLCKYYIDRYESIRTANPKWAPSDRCLSTVAWLKSVGISDGRVDRDD